MRWQREWDFAKRILINPRSNLFHDVLELAQCVRLANTCPEHHSARQSRGYRLLIRPAGKCVGLALTRTAFAPSGAPSTRFARAWQKEVGAMCWRA